MYATHSGMIKSEGRFSIGGEDGEAALYSVEAKGASKAEILEAEGIAKIESGLEKEPAFVAARPFSESDFLDLGDPKTLEALGANYKVDALLQDGVKNTKAYTDTQILGDVASGLGFRGIRSPSVKQELPNPSPVFNIVRFIK